MILLLWLLLLLSCMITYIHYCFIIIVITMLIMIVYYYVYKRLQQFQTRLTGLRKGLVTVNVHFYALYLCVCVRACVHVHCVVCFVSVCPTSCLAYCFGTCSMVSSVLWCPVFSRIFAYIYSSSSSLL